MNEEKLFVVTDFATGLGSSELDNQHYVVHAENEDEALKKVAKYLWEDGDKDEEYCDNVDLYFDRIVHTDMGPHFLDVRGQVVAEIK